MMIPRVKEIMYLNLISILLLVTAVHRIATQQVAFGVFDCAVVNDQAFTASVVRPHGAGLGLSRLGDKVIGLDADTNAWLVGGGDPHGGQRGVVLGHAEGEEGEPGGKTGQHHGLNGQ